MKLKQTALTGFLFLLITLGSHAYAIVPYECNASWVGPDQIFLTTTVAVSASLPKGAVVWRMPVSNRGYSCGRGTEGFQPYLFFNSQNADFSPDLELGVTFNGKDYLTSSMGNLTVPTGQWINSSVGSTTNNDINYYDLSLFLVKKTPAGTAGDQLIPGGAVASPFTLGKLGGTEARYVLAVYGLDKIRSIHCSSTVSINPDTINFGKISTLGAMAGKEIKRVPFNIIEQRTCESPATYGLNGSLTPLSNSNLMDSNSTLVPRDNSSVGINILETDGGKTVVFNKEFEISPQTDTTNHSKQFEARLAWRTSKPTLGEFNAGAILDVYYK